MKNGKPNSNFSMTDRNATSEFAYGATSAFGAVQSIASANLPILSLLLSFVLCYSHCTESAMVVPGKGEQRER